jgi:hypothetical protein
MKTTSKRIASEKQQSHLIEARKAAIDKRIDRIKNDHRRREAIDFVDGIDSTNMTLAAISFKLNEAGHRTARGHFFDATSVKYLVAWRERYYKKQDKLTTK